MKHLPPLRPRILALALLPLALACGSSDRSVGPEVDPPVITVTGIEDGAVATGPVTIVVSISHGTWSATLNGAPFFNNTTLVESGAYRLDIRARAGEATSRRIVDFEIRPGGASVLVVRLFDLGDNDAGGGGDAILLTDSSSAGMEHMVIDAGPEGPGGANTAFVAARLAALGVDTLEALLLTHAHTDHYRGMEDVLNELEVEAFLYNGQVRSLSSYQRLLSVAAARAEDVVAVDELLALELGRGDEPTEVAVLPALPDHLDDPDAGSSELNDGSLGTAVTRGAFRMFFTGDGEVEANRRWRTQFASHTAGVTALKVGHHGANDAVFDDGSSGSSAWLEHTSPALQVISANGTTHPRVRALTALLERTATRTYCTHVHGDIEIRVGSDGAYDVTVERNAGADCVAGSEAVS